eukprot:358644-Chlamydomonas_euryale.AAC.4
MDFESKGIGGLLSRFLAHFLVNFSLRSPSPSDTAVTQVEFGIKIVWAPSVLCQYGKACCVCCATSVTGFVVAHATLTTRLQKKKTSQRLRGPKGRRSEEPTLVCVSTPPPPPPRGLPLPPTIPPAASCTQSAGPPCFLRGRCRQGSCVPTRLVFADKARVCRQGSCVPTRLVCADKALSGEAPLQKSGLRCALPSPTNPTLALACVDSRVCGQQSVCRVECLDSRVCGQQSVWTVECVDSRVCVDSRANCPQSNAC